MNPERRELYKEFIVDANCVNARQEIPAMNKLEQWAADEIIDLWTTEIAQSEMAAGNNSARKEKAYKFVYIKSEIQPEDTPMLDCIEKIIFPNGAVNQSQENDVETVFCSKKHPFPLITNDGDSKSQPRGILGSRSALSKIGIKVLRPEEAVAQIKQLIKDRDDSACKLQTLYEGDLPWWVGKD